MHTPPPSDLRTGIVLASYRSFWCQAKSKSKREFHCCLWSRDLTIARRLEDFNAFERCFHRGVMLNTQMVTSETHLSTFKFCTSALALYSEYK